jgi:hypothetical protein
MDLLESLLLKFLAKSDPQMIIDFCEEKGRVPQIEGQVIHCPILSCDYAIRVIKGRWEEAEEKISQDENSSIRYANYALKDRFPAYEKNIIKNREKIIEYCVSIQKRLPEAEPLLAKGAMDDIFKYAKQVIKGRFELAEPKIITKPKWILSYSDALGMKISEEMHNAMTMFSFQDPNNKVVKEYFKKYGP